MRKSKLIALLLFLLLILIILCTWNHSSNIAQQREILKGNSIATTINKVKKTSIDYYLKKDNNSYELTGNFSNKEDIEKIHHALNIDTLNDTTNINNALEDNAKAIALTEKIIPLLSTNYMNGSIQYRNNKLTINGTVKSNQDRDAVNTLLANSTIESENNTKVIFVPTELIHFKLAKENNSLSLKGLFQSQTEIETLTSRIKNNPLQSNANTNEKLISGKNVIHVSKILVEALNEYYTNGFVAYDGEKLTVEGTVKSDEAKENMEKLLQASGFTYTNNTNVVLPAPSQEELDAAKRLQEQADAKKAEEAKALELTKAQEALNIEAKIKKIIDIENINFAVNKSQLTDKSLTTVSHIADILQEHTKISVEIGGHTDSDGDATYNHRLSQKRVDTVKRKLIDLGISTNRLIAVGYGESNPLVSNDSKENKRLNRRVEFKVKGE